MAQRLKRGRVRIVTPHITHQVTEFFEGHGIEFPAFLQAAARAGFQLVEVLSGPGHADDRDLEMAALDHCLQGWKDLLKGQITRRAKKNEGIGLEWVHDRFLVTRIFHDARRIGSATPTGSCPHSPIRRAN